jgi:3-hydroxybutyryl-CoA dehydratase
VNSFAYDDIAVGQVASFTAMVGPEQMKMFCDTTGDINPLHTEQGVVYGMLTASYLSTLAGVYLPGKHALIYSVNVEFPNRFDLNTEVGESRCITVIGKVVEKIDSFKLLVLKVTITDDVGKKILRGSMKVGVRE